ncbi:MAG: hypothetical protein A2904_00505 [Candidatus Staskawiczbacteria bacterium RIFCSPLOWO2_01_FULL_33_9]|uniref:Uncharacterized protein n=1 Tax=Candidatus Staskawiczbacteria bacterium RIFCSPLOWO2_01_FULL_33_9 TaxID=1802211 RepID=A0A1G2I8U8_9BACT|nr:MAG: hypothetical protein A2904_00505 [Candidatus Staskawiczbacteria bacterium RIFCSPLOWO2_01_FULL_33_9]
MIDKNKEIKQPSGEGLSPEQKIEFLQEGVRVQEKEKSTTEESITKDALRREIDKMELNDDLKQEAVERARTIEALDEEKKVKHLLEITKEKGIVFAVNVADKMNDPYVLDNFRDILVKEWYTYKQFLR